MGSRVCSEHFVDGHPTAENPDPTLKLGHNKSSVPKPRPKRKRSTTPSVETVILSDTEATKPDEFCGDRYHASPFVYIVLQFVLFVLFGVISKLKTEVIKLKTNLK